MLLHHLLLLRLIAANRADGVQWHLRERFIEVRVGGWRGGGWGVVRMGGGGMRGVLISRPWTQRDLGYYMLPMIYLASSFISQS